MSSLTAPCAWASRPWPGVLSAVAGHQQPLRDALQALYKVTKDADRPELAKAVLTLGDNVTLVNVDPIEPGQYLEQGILFNKFTCLSSENRPYIFFFFFF